MMIKPFNKTKTNAVILLRLIVGVIFLSEGIQKFLFPDALGVGRFIKIGIPMPEIMAPFVGVVEIVFGILLVIGLFTKISSLPLIINITVAIVSTKIPLLIHEGFWKMAHEARTDFSMLFCLIFILLVGGGKYSIDYLLNKKNEN